MSHTLLHGDCLDVLRTLPSASVDAVVTDPPYGLSFMGKRWDYDVPSVEVWEECLRVLKPGGHLLAFAGTRTQHRMAVRIEDAGFEIRDMIAWVYGSGFPKSLDVSKAIDKAAGAGRKVITAPATDAARQWQGWGTALKPALEPITVARKPLNGTVAASVLEHGTGALNVDGCRVGDNAGWSCPNGRGGSGWHGRESLSANLSEPMAAAQGRWPANLIHDGSDEVVGLFPVTTSGSKKGGQYVRDVGVHGGGQRSDGVACYGDTGSAARFFACFPRKGGYNKGCQDQSHQPSSAPDAALTFSLQSAAAFIVQRAVAIWPHLAGTLSSGQTGLSTAVTPNESKAIDETVMQAIATIASGFSRESQHERRIPCGSLVRSAVAFDPTATMTITISLLRSDGFAEAATFSITPTNLERGEAASRFRYCAKTSKQDRGEGNDHPTVKPTDLMRYLCRLVTPPGGVVLDPFMGSGSTGKAAVLEGFRFIGIEREAEYVEIARRRIVEPEIEKAVSQQGLF